MSKACVSLLFAAAVLTMTGTARAQDGDATSPVVEGISTNFDWPTCTTPPAISCGSCAGLITLVQCTVVACDGTVTQYWQHC